MSRVSGGIFNGVLAAIGRRSSLFLLLGLVLAAALPQVSAMLRPALPFFVVLVLGLSIARMDIRGVLEDFTDFRKILPLFSLVCLLMPLTCIVLVGLWRFAQFDEDLVFLLVVFAAAPPLSSAASLSLLLGYNARLTLQVTLLATLATPILGPLCFLFAGIDTTFDVLPIMLKIAMINAGGFAIGFALQYLIGKDKISQHKDEFNGVAALAMILFLFPLFDGALVRIQDHPAQAIGLLGLALLLNIFGNITVSWISLKIVSNQTASAMGLMFGNRNISFYLAVLPIDPLLSVFVAVAQLPIYATPALFSKKHKKQLIP